MKRTYHGKKHTRLYNIWCNMKSRCYNPNNKDYADYGSRGIIVCSEWLNNFMAFYNWAMSHGYNETLEIERINNDGNYEPSNCRWATRTEQNSNTRRNHFITFNNETHTMKEWAKIKNIPYTTLASRLNILHWSIEKALTE